MTELHDQMRAGLLQLQDEMIRRRVPFNAVLWPGGADVPTLALVGNGDGWEACYDPSDSRYDLWKDGDMEVGGLTCEKAAERMLNEYAIAKAERVTDRLMSHYPGGPRAQVFALCREEALKPQGNPDSSED